MQTLSRDAFLRSHGFIIAQSHLALYEALDQGRAFCVLEVRL